MSARVIDGKALSTTTLDAIKARVDQRAAEGFQPPGLAVVLVGENPASEVYVRNKRRACQRVGMHTTDIDLPADVGQGELLAKIDALNAREDIHGILVQLPLPAHIDTTTVIERIRADKDPDGFHPYNMGRLALRMPVLRPCTPRGIMCLLNHTGAQYKGSEAVVVGASNIVGRPMVLELLLAGATVTNTHRFTDGLADHIRRADILVVAVGKPNIVPGEWIKPGARVIDVGINRQDDGSLCGDIQFEAAAERASWITPVPGGVGPMTVAMLLQNTLEAAERLEPSEQPG